MRSTRTTPDELGACTKLSPPTAIATCEAPGPWVANQQVAFAHVLRPHRRSLVELIPDAPRQPHAVSRKDVLREAAAVEPARIGAAVPVAHAAQVERGADERVSSSGRPADSASGGAGARGRDAVVGKGRGTAPVEAQPVASMARATAQRVPYASVPSCAPTYRTIDAATVRALTEICEMFTALHA